MKETVNKRITRYYIDTEEADKKAFDQFIKDESPESPVKDDFLNDPEEEFISSEPMEPCV